jgi:hypothetical protein
MLADVKSDKDTYTLTKPEKLDLHLHGAGVAVVVGTANQKGTGKDGKAFDRTHRLPTPGWIEGQLAMHSQPGHPGSAALDIRRSKVARWI